MVPDDRKARLVVYGVVAALIVVSLFSILIAYHTQGSRVLGNQFFRFVIVAFFCVFVYLGHDWARWGMGILGAIIGIWQIAVGIQYFGKMPWWPWPIGFGVFYLAVAAVLIAVPLVRVHFKAGKGKLL